MNIRASCEILGWEMKISRAFFFVSMKYPVAEWWDKTRSRTACVSLTVSTCPGYEVDTAYIIMWQEWQHILYYWACKSITVISKSFTECLGFIHLKRIVMAF
jgi:hypothetical protein